eukprot:CAMPEP_0203751326 /NCGR_PEP_ID=MMETSP0098-20131031/5415_1 /ASSEMBLY_ACC=CAM_ASM_000208 /TAXON_ID=96639 /ORGANISM=" , Strain NY0313808BC1" /LENGTH=220 /DNA_ID=CAMNT_0050640991 /DNA_START=405 /DNA_END=1065 /DNA_ORIENTATION=+
MVTKSILFYTNSLCPFAQRVWICLLELDLKFKMIEVDLYGEEKPDWFFKLNPKGQVPILKIGDKVFVESNDIVSHLVKTYGKRSHLAVKDDLMDIWAKRANKLMFAAKGSLQNHQTLSCGEESDLFHALEEYEDNIVLPFLTGRHFTIADINLAPMLWRIYQELNQNNPKMLEQFERLQLYILQLGNAHHLGKRYRMNGGGGGRFERSKILQVCTCKDAD